MELTHGHFLIVSALYSPPTSYFFLILHVVKFRKGLDHSCFLNSFSDSFLGSCVALISVSHGVSVLLNLCLVNSSSDLYTSCHHWLCLVCS